MPLTFNHAVNLLRSLLTDPRYGWLLAILVLVGDAVLTQLIIRLVQYTEIDWETYMHHIDLYQKGERNYRSITGPTGPLVYPAGHVYIYQLLHKLTSGGLNIKRAQQIFGFLYLLSQALSCWIYLRAECIPNALMLFLPFSKRLHSIYSLRLFNDCWAVVGSQLAILALGYDQSILGTVLFSAALSVKMSVLLYLPGVLLIHLRRGGLFRTGISAIAIVVIQLLLAIPFLSEYPREYLTQAFDLSREFLFEWTVNWRFLGEDLFLSPGWAKVLLAGHLATLLAFANWRWCSRDGGIVPLVRKSLRNPSKSVSDSYSPDEIFTVLMTSNLIGIVFARSLHYQFYSWYAQQLPFLTLHTRYPLVVKFAIILSIEYAWNVFPSTPASSAVLLASNGLLLNGLWFGWADSDRATVTQMKVD